MNFYVMPDGAVYVKRAWTGGDGPPPAFSNPHFIQIMMFLYLEQCRDFNEFWKEPPNLDTAGIFWQRARCDAWRTFSDGPIKSKTKAKATVGKGGTVYHLPLVWSSLQRSIVI